MGILKKYIIFNQDLHSIGGTQMVTAGMANFLEKRGWQVYVFFHGEPHGKSEIPSLTKYISGCGFDELLKRPYKVFPDDRERVLDRMIEILQIDSTLENEIVIESHYDIAAYWAELLAERIHARHYFFVCNEDFRGFRLFYFENLNFLYFKYLRHELLCSSVTFEKIFNGYRDVKHDKFLIPPEIDIVREMDAIQDVENSMVDQIEKRDFNIAYMGRAEKIYVPATYKAVAEFARNHPDKKIQFVIVGKLLIQERIDLLQSLFEKLENVSVVQMGNLVPIPRALFKKLDVVIAGAQTAIFCAYENVPVIATIVDSEKTAGCLYYDVNDAWHGEPKYSFSEMLERVLINREYDARVLNLPDRKPADWHYEKILEIIRKSDQPFEYFTEKFKKNLRRSWVAFFPFGDVVQGSKIVFYGVNDIYFDYLKQIGFDYLKQEANYCQIVATVADDYEHYDRTVLPPEKLTELDYDLIIIAELPIQKRIDEISEKIVRITGKNNFLYSWNVIDVS